jgi:hypothetical protein
MTKYLHMFDKIAMMVDSVVVRTPAGGSAAAVAGVSPHLETAAVGVLFLAAAIISLVVITAELFISIGQFSNKPVPREPLALL